MPAFEGMLVKNTNGRRPVNKPVPPRTTIDLSELTSQVKPTRGDSIDFGCWPFSGINMATRQNPDSEWHYWS